MKFNLTPEIILGIVLIVWGSSILAKIIWDIDIPVFKPVLGILLIYLGLSIIFSSHRSLVFNFHKRSRLYHHDEE
jgi:hypothetical protein